MDSSVIIIWLPCVEDNSFEISHTGLIRSAKTKKVYKLQPDKDGYLRIGFYKGMTTSSNGIRVAKKKQMRVSRLVYATHKGPIPDGMEVEHLDRNRQNNHIRNLACLTSEDNKSRRGVSTVELNNEDFDNNDIDF